MWKGFILGVLLSRFSIWDRFSSTGKIFFSFHQSFLWVVLGLFQGFGCYPAQVAFLINMAHPHSLKQRKTVFDGPRICNKTEVRVVSASGEKSASISSSVSVVF